jgi:hypothetical protein
MSNEKTTSGRLKLGWPLTKRVSVIASDLIRIKGKTYRTVLKVNPVAASILIHAVAPDANIGFRLLAVLDKLNIYGWMIVGIYNNYCDKSIQTFIDCILKEDLKMKNFVRSMQNESD